MVGRDCNARIVATRPATSSNGRWWRALVQHVRDSEIAESALKDSTIEIREIMRSCRTAHPFLLIDRFVELEA